jgi:hypothetical protein
MSRINCRNKREGSRGLSPLIPERRASEPGRVTGREETVDSRARSIGAGSFYMRGWIAVIAEWKRPALETPGRAARAAPLGRAR